MELAAQGRWLSDRRELIPAGQGPEVCRREPAVHSILFPFRSALTDRQGAAG